MKKLVAFWTLLLLIGCATFSQVVDGIILDAVTKEPVPIAVVYFDGTARATYTDEQGKFRLDVTSFSGMPLIISALGYYSAVLDKISSNNVFTIYLEPKIFEFKDVNIEAKGNSNVRKLNMSIFRREFLGRTKNANECQILNEDDIRFIRSENKDTLKAYSLKPLFIVNKALGYRITYYLNKFEFIESAYKNQLIGNSIFDDVATDMDTASIRLRRDNTFYGSKMHFIRALWKADVNPPGYSLRIGKKKINPRDIVRKQLSTIPGQTKKHIYYPEGAPVMLTLILDRAKNESGLELLRNGISIEENGFYKGPGIIWHGEMAKQGIADLLPYDYLPYGEFNDKFNSNLRGEDTISGDLVSNVPELTEKIYLHTDRDIYSPGDDIWFKAYLSDGLTHEPSDSSGNLYIELISPELKILIKRIVKLQKGLGNGDIMLPRDIPQGKYLLRAYTNFLRNFGDQSFFYKNIIITNGDAIPLSVAPDSLKNYSEQTEFSFFPEGGSLVENVLSVVAFKAVRDGSGCEVSGVIRKASGDIVASFSSSHLGMGKFTFRPEEGVIYMAEIANPDGSTFKMNVPAVFQTGFVLYARKNDPDENLITLRTNSKTYSVYKDRDVLVTLSSHGKILKALSVRINSLNTTFLIPGEELPDGIAMITMFGHNNKPLSERLLYINNKPALKVKIKTDKTQYQKRDSVAVKLSVNDEQGIEDKAFLSMSVSNDIYSASLGTNIASWFLLESDIRGPVEDPSSYFDYSNQSRIINLDLLLLTQGWRDFEWKYNENKYFPEKGFIISGRLRRSVLDVPVVNQEITMAIFQDEKKAIALTQTDSSGRFHFVVDHLKGKAQIVICAVNKRGNSAGLLLLDSLDSAAPVMRKDYVSKLLLKPGSADTSMIKATDVLIKTFRKKYSLSDTILIGEVQITGKRKESGQDMHIALSRDRYGWPDKEIVVTPNLRNAGSIKELLAGRAAGVMFVKPASPFDSGIRIRGVSSIMLSQEPLFLLDGLVVPYSTMSSIPISFVDRIDVIMSERAAAFGMHGANGIISVITRNSDYQAVTNSLNLTFEGFSEPRIFFSPKHNSSLSTDYKPDLRSTLLWVPDLEITTNKDYLIKYFNGDISSGYRIVIEGISSDGIPFTGHAEYKILN